MEFEVGDIVGWSDWIDEPPTRGEVVEIDPEYNYLTVKYTTHNGLEMSCMAPARQFQFIMRSVC